MGGRGSSSGMSGGSGGSSSRDYNSNGDYIKKIDTSQFKTDVGSLPQLQGTEKQVALAENIRNDNINALDKELLSNANSYNDMIDLRNTALEKGRDISNWGKIEKSEHDKILSKTKESKDKAHELAVKSVAEFYKQNPKASTVINTRNSIHPKKLASAFRSNPDKMTSVAQGVKYILRDIQRDGYPAKEMNELIGNYKKKFS